MRTAPDRRPDPAGSRVGMRRAAGLVPTGSGELQGGVPMAKRRQSGEEGEAPRERRDGFPIPQARKVKLRGGQS